MTTAQVARDLAAVLAAWEPVAPDQAALRDDYVAFLDADPGAAVRRDGGPEHVTGSCFVLTPDLAHVLLCFHRKGGFWVQVGGHVEPGDASVAEGAFREAREESGLDGALARWSVPTGALPVDLHRHELSGAFGACRAHRDVGYVLVAPREAVPRASDESEDVAWWPVDALPGTVPEDFPRRLATVLAEVRARS